MRALSTTVLFAASLVACRGAGDGTPSPPTSARPAAATSAETANATTSAGAAADKAGAAPRYALVARLPGDAALFDAGEVLVGCESRCAVPSVETAMPKVFVIDAAGSREDASMSIEGAHGISRKELANDKQKNLRVQYFVGPSGAVHASYAYDQRGGGDTMRYDRSLRRSGEKWVPAEYEYPPVPHREEAGPDLDEARAHAPGSERAPAPTDDAPYAHRDALLFGSRGPVLLVGETETWRWDARSWTRLSVPFHKPVATTRLSNGATFVAAEGGAWWWWPTGEPLPIALEGTAPTDRLEVRRVRGALWIAARSADAVKVFAPSDAEAATLAPPPPERPPPPYPYQEGEPMPAATKATPGCPTPFVMISSAKTDSLPDYPITRTALKGHAELQDALTFVDFVRDDTRWFGAQATDNEAADKLVAVLQEKVKGMKPIRGCLDAKSHLGEKQHASHAFRLVLNLAQGTFVARR